MDEPLATVDEVTARVDRELTELEIQAIQGHLEDASALVRFHGLPWTSRASAPALARTITRNAVRRLLNNSEGLVLSRAADETVGFADVGDKAGTVYLTGEEKLMIRELAGRNEDISTAAISPFGTKDPNPDVGYVPVASGGKPFPMFPSEDGPW